MPPELIYSMASATSHVNLFHMFILLCVKRGSTSSPLSLWPFIFRWWPQLLSLSHETWSFCSSEQKSSSGRVGGDGRHASSAPALTKTDSQQKAGTPSTNCRARFTSQCKMTRSPVSRGIETGKQLSPMINLWIFLR